MMSDSNISRLAVDEHVRLATLKSYCLLDTPPDPLSDLLTDLAAKLLNADISLISLIDENRQWFKSRKGLNVVQTPRSDSFCAHAIHQHRPMVVLDATKDERFKNNALVLGDPHIRFYAGAPLITPEGICLGTLCVIGKTPRDEFSDEDLATLEQLGAIVMARLEILRTTGYVDALTTLPNRTRFIEDLRFFEKSSDRLRRSVTAVSVDICDRDYFVDMIKALGWDYAEGFLIQAKNRLVDAVDTSAVYRIGTTLFAYLHYSDSKELQTLIDKIQERFNTPLEHQGIPYTMEISVGIVPVQSSSSSEDLVRSLFTAADLARQDGTGQRVFEQSQGESQKHTFDILSSIPSALLSESQLTLHFQPKVSMRDGKCSGVEALIRWQHPVFGSVSPAVFIPLAEKTALIRRVTKWALREGITQAAKWMQQGRRIPVAINVSARDFDTDELPGLLRALLAEHKIPPGLIEIEFTESAIGKNAQSLREQILDMKNLGVKIAIDDFGAGFSNLSYLKNIPADHMKIDQSFIKGLLVNKTDRMIVPSIMRLGHELGYVVVAEGIECMETYELLKSYGCDHGQGYAIARPMPAADFEAWLEINN
ncbi:EAL domain-containing protein [Herbaspirillum lusitanum]|uniref:EAL domain-containing protein n=1 Tax=Herbaspirillum lusitanum TaxID=213312 RepID=A0ABW9A3K7_9BURK